MRRIVLRCLAATISLVSFVLVVVLAYRTFASLMAATTYNYGVSDMDWNGDGRVTVLEFFAAWDVGMRPIDRDGRQCREFFSLKDGLPIREVCPK